MRRLIENGILVAVCTAWLGTVETARGQETPAAAATRKKLKQKITVEWPKEVNLKDAVADIRGEFDNRLGVKIDNGSGISNNSKVALVAKNQPLAKILDMLSDKYEMGYYVVSDPKDRLDGWIVLRKSKWKERGYKEGKGPKTGASLPPARPSPAAAPRPEVAALPARLSPAPVAILRPGWHKARTRD